MTKRTDHFERLRPQDATNHVPDKDAPRVSSDLVAYLEAQGFGRFHVTPVSICSTQDAVVYTTHRVAEAAGAQAVLQFLRKMINEQEG